MSYKTPLPGFVTEYFDLMDAFPQHFCVEQWQNRSIIEKVFETEELTIYEDRFEKYTGLAKYLGFGRGFEWERFINGLFLCTYAKDGTPRWNRLLAYMGRGAGKDGEISHMGLCAISPYNPVPQYNVDIGAVNETQALRPMKDILKALDRYETKMKKYFHWTKEIITGLKNGGELRGYANNSKGLDGLRPGLAILDEIHGYENNATIEVFKSALGKTDDSRMAFFTTEGYVVDGPLDDLIKRAKKELTEQKVESKFLWFICKLDNEDEVHDEDLWHKANPSLIHKPALMTEMREAYQDWLINPANNVDFICKRMNIKKQKQLNPAATIEQLNATNKELPSPERLREMDCTVGIDYSKTTDWMAVNVHFKDGDERYDLNHAWICAQSGELWRLKCPYQEWEERGLLTLVDEPEIDPEIVIDYVQAVSEEYNVKAVAMDSFRFALLKRGLNRIGFSAEKKNLYFVRNSDIMKVVPIINRCFALGLFHWGDQPVLRWATYNTGMTPAKRSTMTQSGELDSGNYLYTKIEPHARKTDPFMALVASMVVEDQITEGTTEFPEDFSFAFSF